MEFNYLLSFLILFPFTGAVLILIVGYPKFVKIISCVFTFFPFLICILLFFLFDIEGARFQFVEKVPNILNNTYLTVNYHIGIDGFSLLLLGMTTLIFFLSVVYSVKKVHCKIRTFFVSLLLVETSAIGVLISLDTIMFYIMWEIMLFPLVVIVGVWAQKETAVRSTLKYLLFSFSGSIFMLAAILILHSNFSISSIDQFSPTIFYDSPVALKWFLFLSFLFPFCIKTPLFPFHTWMPDFHVNAPTIVSIDLAGVLIKLGLFGLVRFCVSLFPEMTVQISFILIILSLIGIIYGALISFIQKNIKRLIAYSSLSHMGFCMLGFMTFSIEGVTGSMLQLVNHGFVSAMLFMMIGIIYDRVGSLYFVNYGGIAKVVPVFTFFFMIATFATIGFPFTNSFIGEFLILIGAFRLHFLIAIFAGIGVILSAWYMLTCCKNLLYGKLNEQITTIKDLTLSEKLSLSVFTIMIFWIGLNPNFFIQYLEPTVMVYLEQSQISGF